MHNLVLSIGMPVCYGHKCAKHLNRKSKFCVCDCFEAVQLSLDVRGKSTLEESLDLYVQGELMEGDNQYFCEEASKKV